MGTDVARKHEDLTRTSGNKDKTTRDKDKRLGVTKGKVKGI